MQKHSGKEREILFSLHNNPCEKMKTWQKCPLLLIHALNRPFPSSPGPPFQNEGRCSAFDMEIIFHSQANKT